MALWQIEISMKVNRENTHPEGWDWDSLLHTHDGDEIIEVKAIKAEKSWRQEYKELNEFVELIIKGEKSG